MRHLRIHLALPALLAACTNGSGPPTIPVAASASAVSVAASPEYTSSPLQPEPTAAPPNTPAQPPALPSPAVQQGDVATTPAAQTQQSSQRVIPTDHRAIWIGDSLAARGWVGGGTVARTAGSGFVVSGGPSNPVATITTTTPNALIAGNYVQIVNVGDLSYGAALNGAVVRVLATPSSTEFTVSASYGGRTMPNGDYSTGYGGQPWYVSSMYQTSDSSWLQWLNIFLQGYFTVVANYAQGGTASSVGVTLIPKIQAGPKAGYAVIQYCTNDINSGTPNPSGCLANIRTLIAAVEDLGMVPIVCTPPAIGDPGVQPANPGTAAKAAALQAVRLGEQQIAQADSRVILLDTYAQTVHPFDPLGDYLPDYAPVDGIHPSSYGEVKVATNLAAYLRQFVPVTDLLPTSLTDDQTVDSNATNVIQNGMMAGSGGNTGSSAYNSVAGSPPTGWALSGSGGTASNPLSLKVSGNNVHAGIPGYQLNLTVETAGAGHYFQLGTNGVGGSSFGRRLMPGSWYQCGFELYSTTPVSNLNLYGQIFLNFGGGNTPSIYFMSPGGRYDNGMGLNAGEYLEFISAPFFVPAQPAAGAYLFINGIFSGPVNNQSFSLGRAFCHAVTSPYG